MRVSARSMAVSTALAVLLGAACTGCAKQVPDEPNAAWSLLDPAGVSAQSTHLELGVMRIDCASGATGEVIATHLEVGGDQIVIGVVVAPAETGSHTCPGNETVPYTLDLGQPVGERQLVDASCRQAHSARDESCSDGGIRWAPPAAE